MVRTPIHGSCCPKSTLSIWEALNHSVQHNRNSSKGSLVTFSSMTNSPLFAAKQLEKNQWKTNSK